MHAELQEEGGDAEAHPADSDGIIDISAAGTEADAVAGKPLEVTSSKVPEAWVPSDSPPGTASSSLGPRRVSVAASITASQAGDGKRPSLATVKEEGGSSSRLGGTAAAPDSAEIARTSGEAAESMVLEVNNAKRDKAKKQRKERRRSSKVAPAEADGRKSDSLALNIGQLLEVRGLLQPVAARAMRWRACKYSQGLARGMEFEQDRGPVRLYMC